MRVLFVSYNGTTDPLFHTQGVAYLRGVARRGATVHVLTFERRGAPGGQERAWRREQKEALAREGLIWHPLRYHKYPAVLSTLWDVAVGSVVAGWLVLRHGLSILHARGSIPALIALPVARITGRRWLFDLRGLASEEYVDGGLWRRESWLHRLARRVERAVIRRADAIVVLTRRAAELLAHDGRWALPAGVRPTVIPCCVDLTRFACPPPEAARMKIAYVGSVGTWYLFEEMVQFIETLSRLESALQFLVVSPSRDHAHIRRVLRQHPQVEARTTVVCAQPDEVPGYLASTMAGLSFIKPVLSKQFSSPTKIGEYLASGVPVVANAGVGDVDTLVRDHRVGVILPELTAAHYRDAAEALRVLWGDPALRARCQQTARQALDLAGAWQRYWDVYRTLDAKYAVTAAAPVTCG